MSMLDRLLFWRGAKSSAGTRGRWLQSLAPTWQSGQPAAWRDDPAEQVRHFRAWVYAAVSAIAGAVAASPLRLDRRGPDGQPEELREHPFLDLMREVNPFHTRFWLWSETIAFLELTGNAYWWLVSDALGTPREIWLVQSQHMRVIPDAQRFIAGYEFRLHGRTVRFAPDEIIHFKYPNPCSLYYGRGPLQAAAGAVDAHEAVQSAQWHAFRNGAQPGLALSTEQKLDESVLRRLERRIHDRYGGTEQAGKALILEQGMTAHPFTLSPREMDFIRSGEFSREEVLGIFKVPAAIAGIAKDVNRASADSLHQIFMRFTIAPKLQLLAEQLNQDLLPRYDASLVCSFGEVSLENRAEDRADMQARLSLGVTTVNEERARLGLPPAPWGEEPKKGNFTTEAQRHREGPRGDDSGP